MSLDQLQLKELEGIKEGVAAQDVDTDAEHKPEVARNASNASLKKEAVQMKASGDGTTQDAHEAAEQGKASPATALPHHEAIQASFGAHDVSGIRAHTGEKSASAMGAQAYATGNHVMFGEKSPDLHTAAHEAAHVVQQSKGVNLKGGVGEAGDEHEKNADAVADRVVAGKSAEDLLGTPGKVEAKGAGGAVQMKEKKKSTPEEKAAAHVKSDSKTGDSISSSLTLFASHLKEGATSMANEAGKDKDPNAGYSKAAGAIKAVFSNLNAESSRLLTLIKSSHIDATHLKATKAEVMKVQGQFFGFRGALGRANHFLAEKGEGQIDPNEILEFQARIDSYTTAIGFMSGTSLDQDRSLPGASSANLSAAIATHIKGAKAAAESVSAGNTGDSERLALHANEIQAAAESEKGSLKAHKEELRELLNVLKSLQSDAALKPVAGPVITTIKDLLSAK